LSIKEAVMKIAGKTLIVCLMTIAGILALGTHHQVKAYTYYEIDVELGYDNQAKYGRYIPVEINVFSQEDFIGTVSVQRVESDGSIQIYTYPVEISGPNSQTISTQMPLFDQNREFVFVLKDSTGKEIKRRKENVEVFNEDYTELFVGVVDENGVARVLFDEKNIGEYSNTEFPYVMTRAISLKTSQIQGDFKYTLDCLDIIVVTDASMQSLGQENIDCLLEWVAAGNTLVMEYGSNFNQIFVEMYEEAYNNRLAEDEVLRPGLWIMGTDYGKGKIGFFTSFISGSSFLSFAVTNPELIGMILRRNCSTERINDIIENDIKYAGKDDSYAVRYMFNTAIGKTVPNIRQYIAVIVIYILFAGPVLYLLLRKKHRAGLMLLFVLILAGVFSYVINKMGEKTRFTDMFLQYASVIDISEDKVDEITYMCANVPYKDTYYMRVPDEYRIRQLTETKDYTEDEIVASNSEEYVELVYSADDIKLILENKVPFSRTYLEASRRYESHDKWQFDVDITYYDGVFTGTVINRSDKDYQQLAVVVYGKILLLGELKAGESVDVYDAEVVTLPYYSNDAAKRIIGLDKMTEQSVEYEDELLDELNGKAGVVEHVINKYFNAKSTSPILVGFTNDREGAFQFDDRYEALGFTMVYKEIDIDTSIGNLTYKPLSYTDVVNPDSNSTYDAYSNTTYSSRIRLQYNLENSKSLVRVIFDFGEDIKDNYYGIFSGTTYFYNYETLTYDEVDISKEYFYVSELEPYLKENNNGYTLTVQYNVNTTGQFRYTEVKLPAVSVVRRNIYVENTEP